MIWTWIDIFVFDCNSETCSLYYNDTTICFGKKTIKNRFLELIIIMTNDYFGIMIAFYFTIEFWF